MIVLPTEKAPTGRTSRSHALVPSCPHVTLGSMMPRLATLIERTRDGGRKILISGGRCNVLPAVFGPAS